MFCRGIVFVIHLILSQKIMIRPSDCLYVYILELPCHCTCKYQSVRTFGLLRLAQAISCFVLCICYTQCSFFLACDKHLALPVAIVAVKIGAEAETRCHPRRLSLVNFRHIITTFSFSQTVLLSCCASRNHGKTFYSPKVHTYLISSCLTSHTRNQAQNSSYAPP